MTPFLPGDSLLFAVGALAAVDTSGTLRAPLAEPCCLARAAVLGNIVNYSIGRAIGPPAFSGRYRLLRVEYLERTEEFFRRYGGLAILAVALHADHPHLCAVRRRRRAHALRALPRLQPRRRLRLGAAVRRGAATCSATFPLVKQHFGLVTLGIIAVSLVPLAARRCAAAAAAAPEEPRGRAPSGSQDAARRRGADEAADEQRRDSASTLRHEARVALPCADLHVAAEVQRAPDDEQRAERGRDVRRSRSTRTAGSTARR